MGISLSVAIITFNEQDNIEECLRSVQKVADEILVIDSFSKDNTEKKHNFYNQLFSGFLLL